MISPHLRLPTVLVLLAMALNALPHAEATRNADGAKVILLEKGSTADKAGIQVGDVILGWLQNGKRRNVESPVDLAEVEHEWGPRGHVVLIGQRDGAIVKFDLTSAPWGLHAGPNFPDLWPVQEQARSLLRSHPVTDLEEYCRATCLGLSARSRPWAYLEVARLVSLSARQKDADEFFGAALSGTPPSMLSQRALIEYAWGEACRHRADWTAAKEHYSSALADQQKLTPSSLAVGLDLYNLALVEFSMGDIAAAERRAIQALHLRRKLSPQSLDVVKTLNYLGAFSLQAGDVYSAEDYFKQSLTLAEHLNPGGREMAFALNNLGATAEKRGEMGLAEHYYSRDLEISTKLNPGDYLLSYSLGNLGTIAFERGNLSRAKTYYSQALKIQQQNGTGKDVALTLNNLAAVSAEENDLSRAEQLLRQALAIQEIAVPNSVELAQTLDTLGTVLRRSGNFKESKEVLERALAFRQSQSPGSLDEAEIIQHLGELFRDQDDPIAAENHFSAAAQIRQTLAPASAAYADSLADLAQSARLRDELDQADSYLGRALDVLDAQGAQLGGARESRMHFGAKYSGYYSDYIALLMQRGAPKRALEVLERSKARTLVNKLAAQEIRITGGIPRVLLNRQNLIQAMINEAIDKRVRAAGNQETGLRLKTLDRKIDELKSERERVLSEISMANGRYAYLSPVRPLRLLDIQNLLDPETLLLEYSVGSSGSHVFAITSSGVESFALPVAAVIRRLVQQFYTEVSAPPGRRTGSPVEAAAALSKMVLGPLATTIGRYRRIVIACDKALNYVPFASLPPAHPTVEEPYLVSRHEVVEVPSASFLAMLRRSNPSSSKNQFNRVAVIADPVFANNDPRVRPRHHEQEGKQPRDSRRRALITKTSGWVDTESRERRVDGMNLERLLYSRAEADAIVSEVGPGRVFEALNFAANRTIATSPQVLHSRIVHYATHGVFDSQDPDLTGMVFSTVDEAGKPRPGFWGIDEVFNSSVSADLVVLSACETALGQEWEGEGTVGLTRAFMYAGAKNVLASLWRIDDAGTAEFFRLFYEAMEHRGMPPSSALRWAQLEIAKQDRWNDPYYWAGFTIQGDWQSKHNDYSKH